MTVEQAKEELFRELMDGIAWESTPLYSVWEHGDFPEGTDNEYDFDDACKNLGDLHSQSAGFNEFPRWIKIFILMHKYGKA